MPRAAKTAPPLATEVVVKKTRAPRKTAKPLSEEPVVVAPVSAIALSSDVETIPEAGRVEKKIATTAEIQAKWTIPSWTRGPVKNRSPSALRDLLLASPCLLFWLGPDDQKRLATLVKELVTSEPMSLVGVRNPTKALIEAGTTSDGVGFLFVDDAIKTPALCASEVEKYPHLLMYSPYHTPAVLKAAGSHPKSAALYMTLKELAAAKKPDEIDSDNDDAFFDSLPTTEDGWLAAIEEDWSTFQFCPPPFRTKRLIEKAISLDVSNVAALTTQEQTTHAVLITNALIFFPMAICLLRKPTEGQILQVMKQFPLAFPLLRPSDQTQEANRLAIAVGEAVLFTYADQGRFSPLWEETFSDKELAPYRQK